MAAPPSGKAIRRLWESTQGICEVRGQIAEKLQLPEHHVRVIKQYMGGGFGAKQIAWKQTVIAALLSKHAGRPVQLMLDREPKSRRGQPQCHPPARAHRGNSRWQPDGAQCDIKVAIGAYMAGGEGSNVSAIYQRLYQCPNVRTEQMGIYINAGPSIAFRAPGHVEGAFALESAMDELARALNMDPLALRLRNYANTDQKKGQPYTTPTVYNSVTSRPRQCLAGTPTAGPLCLAPNGAVLAWPPTTGAAGFPPGYAWVKLNSDGTADVVTATQDIGTGTRTGLLQVAAEELGLPMSHVALHLGDTAHGPYAPVSAGSATQATIGPAVRVAAAEVKRQLLEVAATVLEEKPERLRVHNGMIRVEGKPAPAVSVEDLTQRIAPHMIQGWGGRQANPTDKSVRTFGAQCVEVEVDIDTGEVTILRIVAAHDCGRIINATMVDSQVIGGITQGIGFALTEERVMDVARGIVLNANLEEYKVPTVADIPSILHAQVNLPDPEANLTGAKGIGEPPLVPTAPAIANAVFDAIGVRIRHTPLSCHRLLTALAAREAVQSQPEDGESV